MWFACPRVVGCRVACALGLVLLLSQASLAAGPATVAEAAKTLNLAKFPRLPMANPPQTATVANLSYSAPAKVDAAYKFQKTTLEKQGWKELPGGYVTDQYASGTFSKNGYKVSVSVIPDGETAGVMLNSHGNVDLAKLPLPAGTKPLYEGPVSRMVVTEAAAAETKAAIRELLKKAGWSAYGVAGETDFFRQNAVRLGVTVQSAPAQGNKTVIDMQATLMSVELPAPESAEGLQYSDSTMAISFDSPQSIPELCDYYRKALAPAGWKATTDQPIKLDFREALIFRNPAKELAELQVHTFEGKTRALLKFQTAEMVAAEEAAAKAMLAAKNATKGAAKPVVKLTLPAGIAKPEQEAASAELTLKTGQAKAVIETWKKALEKEGWKVDVAAVDPAAGALTFTRETLSLTLTYVDPGFIPAEISISVSGGELQLVPAK